MDQNLINNRLTQLGKTFLDPRVVDTQELVGTGSHVDVVGLALSALLVDELVHLLVCGRPLEIGGNHLEQRLAQVWRTTLRGRVALALVGCVFKLST